MAGCLRTVLIDGGTGASASNEVQAGFARLSGIATALGLPVSHKCSLDFMTG